MANTSNYIMAPQYPAEVSYDDASDNYNITVKFKKIYCKGALYNNGYSKYYIFYNVYDKEWIDQAIGDNYKDDWVENICTNKSEYYKLIDTKTSPADSITFSIKKNAVPYDLFIYVYNHEYVPYGTEDESEYQGEVYNAQWYSDSSGYALQAAHIFRFPFKAPKPLDFPAPAPHISYDLIDEKYQINFLGTSYGSDTVLNYLNTNKSIAPSAIDTPNAIGKTAITTWELYRNINNTQDELLTSISGLNSYTLNNMAKYKEEDLTPPPSQTNPIKYTVKTYSNWTLKNGEKLYYDTLNTDQLIITRPLTPLVPTITKITPTSPNVASSLDENNIKIEWGYNSADGSQQMYSVIRLGYYNDISFTPAGIKPYKLKEYTFSGNVKSATIVNEVFTSEILKEIRAESTTRHCKPVIQLVVFNYITDYDNLYNSNKNSYNYTTIEYPIFLDASIPSGSFSTEANDYFISEDKKESSKLKFKINDLPFAESDSITSNNIDFTIDFINPDNGSILCTYKKVDDVQIIADFESYSKTQQYYATVSNIRLFDNQFLNISNYLEPQKEYTLRLTVIASNIKKFYTTTEENFYYDAILPIADQEFTVSPTQDNLAGATAHVKMKADQQGTNGEYLPRYITLSTTYNGKEIILLNKWDIMSNYPAEISITELYNYQSDTGIYEFEIDTPEFYNLPLDTDNDVYLTVTNGINTSRKIEIPQKIKVESHGNIFISFGETNSDIIKLRRNATFDVDSNVNQNLYNVLGRKYPLQYLGSNYTQDISISGDVKFPSEIYEWYAAHESVKSAYLRIPYGFTSYVAVNGISISKGEGLSPANISLDLTKIDDIK